MGDSLKIYHYKIEIIETSMDFLLCRLEEIINEKNYKISSYNVVTKSCQTFVHDLSKCFTRIDFPKIFPIEYDYKVKRAIWLGYDVYSRDISRFYIYDPYEVPVWVCVDDGRIYRMKENLEKWKALSSLTITEINIYMVTR
jgi:hypothetical protein